LIGLLLGVGNYEINYNIEIRMYNFSRKLVVFFIIVFAQSSLGTNAIQLESQNLWNEKAKNGYVKYSNGLLMQWGTRAGATGAISLYFPTSFYDTNYNVYLTAGLNVTSEPFVYAPGYDPNNKNKSYIIILARGINSTPAIVWTSWDFTWFAIGRWKL
jgi:hypothetical protein